MSAAASAEMIETPPVLNFEEIDYKEIEVEEVSEGPTARPPPPAPRARPAWWAGGTTASHARSPGWLSPAPAPAAEGAAEASCVCWAAGTPPSVPAWGFPSSPDATALGTGEQRRYVWEPRCQLTFANPGAVLLGSCLSGVHLFGTFKF